MTDLRESALAALAMTRVLFPLILATPAAAGVLTIDPVRVNLTDDRKIAALRIVNQDTKSVAIRVTALRWEQRNGVDAYADTTDLVASPPIFAIPAGSTQLLRAGLRDNSTARFRAYRLIVEEVPRLSTDSSVIQIAVKMNLPLYALPKLGKASQLSWQLVRDEQRRLVLEATNAGDQPVRVQEIDAAAAAGKRTVLSTALGVVLPGSARRWAIEGVAPLSSFRLIAKTDSGEQAFQIAPQ